MIKPDAHHHLKHHQLNQTRQEALKTLLQVQAKKGLNRNLHRRLTKARTTTANIKKKNKKATSSASSAAAPPAAASAKSASKTIPAFFGSSTSSSTQKKVAAVISKSTAKKAKPTAFQKVFADEKLPGHESFPLSVRSLTISKSKGDIEITILDVSTH